MANESRELFKTQSGLKPDDNGVPFSITTNQVEKYLQQKTDYVAKSAGIDDVQVKVYTTEPGKYFCPFIMVLPVSALKEANKSSEDDEPAIFNPSKQRRKAMLKDPLYHLYKLYTYNEQDEKAFFSNEWKNKTGLRSDASQSLAHLRVPHVTKADGADVVVFLLDPLKVFHDMLKFKDDNRQYHVDVKTLKKIRTGEFVYGVERNLAGGKGNKKYKDIFINEINKKLRGGRSY